MEGDTVGQHRIKAPVVDEPATHIGMRRAEQLQLFALQLRVLTRIGQKTMIRVANGREQDQFADVVQQPREVGFIGMRIFRQFGYASRHFTDQQRVTPVVGDIEFVEVGVAVEKFLDGKAGCQRTHEACAQCDQAGFQIFEFTSPA